MQLNWVVIVNPTVVGIKSVLMYELREEEPTH